MAIYLGADWGSSPSHQFKKGDKVQLRANSQYQYQSNGVGTVEERMGVLPYKSWIEVEWENGSVFHYPPEYLVSVNGYDIRDVIRKDEEKLEKKNLSALYKKFRAQIMEVMIKDLIIKPKTMGIVQTAKNLLLSGTEKKLRKAGLKDECGFTKEARQIVMIKMCQDNIEHLLEVAKVDEDEKKKEE